jgi:HTH-type transcriptional repressor of NAD biosynthesis genes
MPKLKAFVFGKFLPFHKGHEAMIAYALSQCDFLSILVCASDRELLAGKTRQEWIEQTFANRPNLEVRLFEYLEEDLPNSSESSKDISKLWSAAFKEQFPDYQLVITSEPYGAFVANFMGIQHRLFDQNRLKVPISATAIRQDLFQNWRYLPKAVRSYFAIKVVILGTESTGKTTLTQQLAQHYHCQEVLEAGRDLIPDSKAFEYEDLYVVASEHAQRIHQASQGEHPLIIIDTDIHITSSYAKFIFQRPLTISPAIYKTNQAHLYLYLNAQVPHVQDGTRLELEERNLLDASHRQTLMEHKIDFVEISGAWDSRLQQALLAIDELLKDKKNAHSKLLRFQIL